MNKELLCKIGIHDKEIAGMGLSCLSYIKCCLYKEDKSYDKDNQATRDFFMQNNAEIIYRNIYSYNPRTKWALDVVIQDYVCVRCSKCFENIRFEKFMLEEQVLKYLEKRKNKEIRKQMASDLYRENCEQQ